MSWLSKKPIAHRGLHDDIIPENSKAAFQKAIEVGYAFELDVHLSKDKKLIVMHDENLKRMTGVDKNIADESSEYIKTLTLLQTQEKIPTLDEVLVLVEGKVPLLIEVKNEGKVGELEERVYEMLKGYKGEFAIQSFNPFTLGWFAKNASHILRGQLSGRFEDVELPFYTKFLLGNLLLNGFSKPHFIVYESVHLPNLAVSISKIFQKTILAWTIDSEDKIPHAREHANNIVFKKIRPRIENV